MVAYNISPLSTIPLELLRAFRDPERGSLYLAQATELLRDTLALDFHLATASVAEPGPEGTDFYLDCRQIHDDWEAAEEVFLRIRHKCENIAEKFPLLLHAAGLLDYTAQMLVNIMPTTERKPRPYARIAPDGSLSFPWSQVNSVEGSFAIYLGLSPFPMFLDRLDHGNPNVAATLAPFGFGVFPYLAVMVIPELALQGIPPDIHRQWSARPIARACVRNASDGSFFLKVP